MKYYYTDPFAAAWMTKHFGVKIYTVGLSQDKKWLNYEESASSLASNIASGCWGIYYIHPDSMTIFEPVEGDIGIECKHYPMVCVYGKNDWIGDALAEEKGHFPEGPIKIIQRNGIPFMWPEV